MADFRIWGRVEHVGVRQFLAIVSGVPARIEQTPIVRTSISPNLIEANQSKADLMREVGEKIQSRGDRVVDVDD